MSLRGSAAALLLLCLFCTGAASRGLQGKLAVDVGPCSPQQLHISLTGNPSELRVSWKTRSGSCPSAVTLGPADALLQQPPDPALLTRHIGVQRSYSSEDMCAPPARRFGFGPTYLHTALLTGLEPRGRYFYQVEGGHPVEFVAPVPAGPDHSFTFLVFGDMGESEHREAKSPGASRTVEMLQQEFEDGAELVMHIGDIAYANGREEVWDTFMDSIEPFARHIPYMVGTGNHEYTYELARGSAPSEDPSGEAEPYSPDWGNFGNDSGGECGVQLSHRFAMPDVADYGYWSRNLSNTAADALLAAAAENGGAGGGGANGRPRNPTLGPDAGAFMQKVEATAHSQYGDADAGRQQKQQQQQAGAAAEPGAGAMAAAAAAAETAEDRAALPNPPFWYSFSHGSVHFVVLSTEHNLEQGSRQYQWLERDLARVDRCLTPWVVVAMHRPMYVVYPHKSNRIVGDHLRDQLEGLLDEYRVDLVVSGHVHSYSRTCNVLDERCVPADEGGMTHIIVGCAGHKLTDMAHGQEDWLEYAAVRFGYGRVTVDSGYSLLFEMVGEDRRVYDSVKLHNSRANLRGCGLADEDAGGDAGCPHGICPPWHAAQQRQQAKGAAQQGLHADAGLAGV